jgi:hypothetical protein
VIQKLIATLNMAYEVLGISFAVDNEQIEASRFDQDKMVITMNNVLALHLLKTMHMNGGLAVALGALSMALKAAALQGNETDGWSVNMDKALAMLPKITAHLVQLDAECKLL